MSSWKADGDATDSTDGNNGTLTGNVSFAPGVSNQAFQFTGTPGQSVYVPYNANLDLQVFTIELWVNKAPRPILMISGRRYFKEQLTVMPDSTATTPYGGWRNLHRADGSTFKNQGDCIQYVHTGK